MRNTTIIIPCFNEASRLPRERFEAFARDPRGVRLLLVDDGSRDATLELLRDLERSAPDVFGVHALPGNRGKGEAVRLGMLRAMESDPEFVGFWDADLATPLEAIWELRQVLEERPGTEMVFGSRVKLLGRRIERRAARHYLGRIFATVVSLTLRLPVYDTQCGAKIFRASEPLKALLAEPFTSRWIFDVEIIARLIDARRAGGLPRAERVIYEYPLVEWHHVAGSKVGPFDFLRAAADLLRLRFKYSR